LAHEFAILQAHLENVGTLLKDGHFGQAKQFALDIKATLPKARRTPTFLPC
jgi:hypothetical protein